MHKNIQTIYTIMLIINLQQNKFGYVIVKFSTYSELSAFIIIYYNYIVTMFVSKAAKCFLGYIRFCRYKLPKFSGTMLRFKCRKLKRQEQKERRLDPELQSAFPRILTRAK